MLNICNFYGIRKVQNPLNTHEGSVRNVICLIVFTNFLGKNNILSLLNQNDIGMIVYDSDSGRVISLVNGNVDIKNQAGIRKIHLDFRRLHIFLNLLNLFRRNGSNDLELLIRLSGNNSCCNSRINPSHMPGIRHHNALYILNDIAACRKENSLRNIPQHFSCLCSRISNGNRLRTPHCREQFLFQNAHIFLIHIICPNHILLLYINSLNHSAFLSLLFALNYIYIFILCQSFTRYTAMIFPTCYFY